MAEQANAYHPKGLKNRIALWRIVTCESSRLSFVYLGHQVFDAFILCEEIGGANEAYKQE